MTLLRSDTDLLGSAHLCPPGGRFLDELDLAFVAHVLPLARFNAVRRVGRPTAGWDATVARVVEAHGGARSRWDLVEPAPSLATALTQARIDTSAGHLRRLGFQDVGPTVTQWERPALTSSR